MKTIDDIIKIDENDDGFIVNKTTVNFKSPPEKMGQIIEGSIFKEERLNCVIQNLTKKEFSDAKEDILRIHNDLVESYAYISRMYASLAFSFMQVSEERDIILKTLAEDYMGGILDIQDEMEKE